MTVARWIFDLSMKRCIPLLYSCWAQKLEACLGGGVENRRRLPRLRRPNSLDLGFAARYFPVVIIVTPTGKARPRSLPGDDDARPYRLPLGGHPHVQGFLGTRRGVLPGNERSRSAAGEDPDGFARRSAAAG